jgi:hypothetical protein
LLQDRDVRFSTFPECEEILVSRECPDTGRIGIEQHIEVVSMETPNKANPKQTSGEAEAHIKSAHQILKALQEKIGEHPEIGAAITKLEMALNDLAVQTGGVL